MKSFVFLFAPLLLACLPLAAQPVVVNGVDSNGYMGVYEVDGSKYWWLCIEPQSTPAAVLGDSFFADQISFAAGWDQQNTERQTIFSNSPAAQAALSRQIGVMSYVLDEYLPISTLQTPNALLEHNDHAGFYDNNEAFYNSMNAVQHFLAEVYGKPAHTDFSNLVDFDDRWENDLSDAGVARSQIYQDILADIAARGGSFFDTYVAENSYLSLNTLQSLANTDPSNPNYNWQDALMIAIPVPEPGGALLIGCFGLSVMLRRWRKLK